MENIYDRAEEFASIYPHDMQHFLEGKLRRQEMIKEAKQWLKENVDNYLYNTGGEEEYIPKCGDKMFNDFEKAMLKK